MSSESSDDEDQPQEATAEATAEVLPWQEVDYREMFAVVLHHLAHLPPGTFWPYQVLRKREEVIDSVYKFRSLPEYESWLQLAESQMSELDLVPGITRSTVTQYDEKALTVAPIYSEHRLNFHNSGYEHDFNKANRPVGRGKWTWKRYREKKPLEYRVPMGAQQNPAAAREEMFLRKESLI